MYNVTALDLLNNISPTINAFAALLQAVAAIGLFAVTILLWKAASESKAFVGKQTEIMNDQLKIIEKQNENYEKQTEIMDKQVCFLEKQGCIMEDEAKAKKEDREYQMSIEKYKRLQDEMDKLVGPLYIHASIYNEKEPGYFDSFNQAARDTAVSKGFGGKFDFWDGIQKSLYLSKSDNLAEYIQLHFKYMYISRHEDKEDSRKQFSMNRTMLINEIKNQHERLKKELDDVKKELGMQKTQ
ncbi:MAG TPA: hypothetical protein PLX30_00995 [Methanothrix sp.]|nr:hypothetical protein [Methanothrix sp.]